ncbi:MAG: GTPase-activating protein [Phylliscum demangeonii]|nr:MAG: GTPase-activating protein [Phylliscum demangeonii]
MESSDLQDVQEVNLHDDDVSRHASLISKAATSVHRISTTSLDDISLEEISVDPVPPRSRSSTLLSKISGGGAFNTGGATSPPLVKAPMSPLDLAVPALPQAKRPVLSPPPPPRKLTSPFSWLSRNMSLGSRDIIPPSPATALAPGDLTGAASFSAVTGAQPELTLGRIEARSHGGHQPRWQSSNGTLRDRFKTQRMKDEAGIVHFDEENENYAVGSPTIKVTGHSTSVPNGSAKAGDAGKPTADRAGVRDKSPAVSVRSQTFDPSLAPGTASGMSAGPSSTSDSDGGVDWDLWQTLVYEGPAAVAQKSSAELSQAIASGIPSAIRGVVWQVLANSKNEELEQAYEKLANFVASQSSSKKTAANGSKPDEENVAGQSSEDRHGPESPSGVASPASIRRSSLSIFNGIEPGAQLAGLTLPTDQDLSLIDAAHLTKLEKTIKRDLGARTSFSRYAVSAGLQDGLFRICKAYALLDKEVGYAQGINFLVMPLLFNMPEAEAYCLLVRLMYHYQLREMFRPEMPGLHLHLYQFQRLLEDHEPALSCHLQRRGVDPILYATQWFLTLFAYRFPLQLVLRVYDLILSEGLEEAVLRFGLVLMQKNAQTLMETTDMSTLTHFLKERLFDVYIDQAPSASSILESGFFGNSGGSDKAVYRADALVQDACAVKLNAETLKSFTAEWEEKVRSEKEREAEYENLRTSNASLSAKVRTLEERSEQFDAEHVQVATDLVRTKLENEELKDENETLKSQIDELKNEVEKQPQEVEAKLKEEMDRIMQRNLEVHNENRALEEQLLEMEKDLVDAKMRYAEIDSAHETLKQKWNDLKKALDS